MISRKYNGMSNVVGQKLKELRISQNMSQNDLSNKLMLMGIDINSDGIYKIEKGKRILKDFELSALCIALGIKETDLLGDFRNEILKDA